MIDSLNKGFYRSHFGSSTLQVLKHKLQFSNPATMAALFSFISALKDYGKKKAESDIYNLPKPFDPMDGHSVVAHTLHDAAKTNRWNEVWAILEQCPQLVNSTAWADAEPEVIATPLLPAKPGKPSFPRLCLLGQAIYHDDHVAVEKLIRLGANIYLKGYNQIRWTTMLERAQNSSDIIRRVFSDEEVRLRDIYNQHPSLEYIVQPVDPPPEIPNCIKEQKQTH